MLRNAKTQTALVADKPLFSYPEEYERFRERHAAHDVARGDYRTYAGKAYLGIDAGSTTTKIVLLSETTNCCTSSTPPIRDSRWTASSGNSLPCMRG